MRHRAQAVDPVLRGLRGSACCRVQSLANEKEEMAVSSMEHSVRIDVLIEELSSFGLLGPALACLGQLWSVSC